MVIPQPTISKQLEYIREEVCTHYCKYPERPIPEGRTEDWLFEDDDSPCQSCPLSRI